MLLPERLIKHAHSTVEVNELLAVSLKWSPYIFLSFLMNTVVEHGLLFLDDGLKRLCRRYVVIL